MDLLNSSFIAMAKGTVLQVLEAEIRHGILAIDFEGVASVDEQRRDSHNRVLNSYQIIEFQIALI